MIVEDIKRDDIVANQHTDTVHKVKRENDEYVESVCGERFRPLTRLALNLESNERKRIKPVDGEKCQKCFGET